MRRLAMLGLGAALGLVVAAPGRAQGLENPVQGLPTHVPVGHMCDACAKKLPKRVPVVVNSGMPMEIAVSQMQAPGIAQVGPHGPGLAAGEEAPGFASIGGPAARPAHGDPAPIGVMRTNYSVPSAATGPVPVAAMAARPVAPQAAQPAPAPGQAQAIIPPPSPNTGKKRPWVLGAMLGIPRSNQFNAYQREVERSNHAMTRYDENGPGATSLPASAVYGR